MTHRDTPNQSGFTLIEIIVTVVIVAVFCAMMLVLLSDSFIKSSDAVGRLSKSSAISEVMANITLDYALYPKWKASTSYSALSPANKVLPTGMNGRFYICTHSGTSAISEPTEWRDHGETQDGNVIWKSGIWMKQTAYAVGDMVIPKTPNGHFYRCITAGISGTTEPTWPLTGSDLISDTGVKWRRLLDYLNLQIGAKDSTQNNAYGKYQVVENRFVKFVSNSIQPISLGDPENILEVKIKNDEGDTLSTLFTAQVN